MLRDVIANWIYILASAIAAFVLYPFFVETLGEEQYGVWLQITAITGYFTLLQLGLPATNVKFISAHWAREEYSELNDVLRSNLYFIAAIDVIVLAAGGGVALSFGYLFETSPGLIAIGRLAVIISAAEVAVGLLGTLFEGVLHAWRDFVQLNVIRIIAVVGRVVAVIALVRAENGLLWVAGILIAGTTFQLVSFILYVRRKSPEIRVSRGRFNRETVRRIFGYNSMAFVDMASRISFNSDAIVIGAILASERVVAFGVAGNMMTYVMTFMMGVAVALMPRVSALEATGASHTLGDAYLRYSRLVGFMTVPTCLSLWRFGDDFIALWMGEDYRVVSGEILTILTIGYVFFLPQRGVAFPILMGMSKMAFATKLLFAGAFVNIGLSIWWAPRLGLAGVAWGTTLPLLAVTGGLILHCCRLLAVDPRRYFTRAILAPAASAIPFLAAAWAVERTIPADTVLGFLASVAVCTGAALVASYFILLSEEERAPLLARLRR